MAHRFIAECSLLYLMEYVSSTSKSNDLPLLKYAASFWPTHNNLTSPGQQKKLSPLIKKLLFSSSLRTRWLEVRLSKLRVNDVFKDFENSGVFNTSLLYAADLGLLLVLKDLLDCGYDPNGVLLPVGTPLHRAVIRGHYAVVLLLLSFGADVDARDISGRTPLHHSLREDGGAIVRVLLSHGAEVNSQDDDGWTPLHLAAFLGLEDIAQLLLENGAIVEARICSTQQTPFHWAAFSEIGPLVDLFIKYGANVNAKNDGGETALHYAAKYCHKIVKQLLANNADPNIRSNNGCTPLYWAATGEAKESVETLVKAGASVDVAILLSAKDGMHQLLFVCPADAKLMSKKRIALDECARKGYGLCNKCWGMLL
jgi:ankyrin repeat protein